MTRIVLKASGMAEISRVVDSRLVHPITDEVAADMRRYVPVLSGALRGTIRAEHGAGFGRVYFGNPPGVGYHWHNEFGTSRMAAQPYARPALYKRRSV